MRQCTPHGRGQGGWSGQQATSQATGRRPPHQSWDMLMSQDVLKGLKEVADGWYSMAEMSPLAGHTMCKCSKGGMWLG